LGSSQAPPENRPARVRLALPSDAPALASVFIEAWKGSYRGIVADSVIDALDFDDTTKWLGELIASKSTQTLVAELTPGHVVGFTRFGMEPDNPGNGHIFALYVAPSATGHGIGRLLIEKALAVLDPLSIRPITLWVFEDNARARKIYSHAGFVPDGGRRVEDTFGTQEVRLRHLPVHGQVVTMPSSKTPNDAPDVAVTAPPP
jgi:GNAT superfamily N-acetyltransferase